MKTDFSSFNDIYDAIANGRIVKWKNGGYTVTPQSNGQYLIIHANGSAVGLYEPDYNPEDFYISEGEISSGAIRTLMNCDQAFTAIVLYSLQHNDPHNMRIALRAYGFNASPESGDRCLEMAKEVVEEKEAFEESDPAF